MQHSAEWAVSSHSPRARTDQVATLKADIHIRLNPRCSALPQGGCEPKVVVDIDFGIWCEGLISDFYFGRNLSAGRFRKRPLVPKILENGLSTSVPKVIFTAFATSSHVISPRLNLTGRWKRRSGQPAALSCRTTAKPRLIQAREVRHRAKSAGERHTGDRLFGLDKQPLGFLKAQFDIELFWRPANSRFEYPLQLTPGDANMTCNFDGRQWVLEIIAHHFYGPSQMLVADTVWVRRQRKASLL